jgi:FtsP/CotA-like multicopper oxidase with cupredoxin domain
MMTLMMEERMPCMNTTYKVGKTYDFYFINLTPDAHPIHFHLINLQKVKQFKFNVEEYEKKYFEINNGEPDIRGWTRAPIDLDPEEFRTGADEYPIADEKVFRDTVNVFPEYVTVLRVNFAKNDGTLTKSFDMKGQMYVLHCHILEHEDNSMMINYCLE